MCTFRIFVAVILMLALANPVLSKDTTKMDMGGKMKVTDLQPQTTCPIMGMSINPDLYVDYQGKRIYVCTKDCLAEVRRDPEAAIRKLAESGQTCAPTPSLKQSAAPAAMPTRVRTIGFLLFPGFQMLDVAGPLEIWGNLRMFSGPVKLVMVAAQKGEVTSSAETGMVAQYGFDDCPPLDMIVVPGGMGSRKLQKDPVALEWLRRRAEKAEIVMSVCTGASVLAAAGLLDGQRATTNKFVWASATKPYPKVKWVASARWVDEGKFVTSSGISAGIDMSLHVVERLFGREKAKQLANMAEYEWHSDPSWDPFAKIHGLVETP